MKKPTMEVSCVVLGFAKLNTLQFPFKAMQQVACLEGVVWSASGHNQNPQPQNVSLCWWYETILMCCSYSASNVAKMKKIKLNDLHHCPSFALLYRSRTSDLDPINLNGMYVSCENRIYSNARMPSIQWNLAFDRAGIGGNLRSTREAGESAQCRGTTRSSSITLQTPDIRTTDYCSTLEHVPQASVRSQDSRILNIFECF